MHIEDILSMPDKRVYPSLIAHILYLFFLVLDGNILSLPFGIPLSIVYRLQLSIHHLLKSSWI